MNKKLSKAQILHFMNENRQRLKDRYHIKELKLIGSFSTNTYTDQSDVDIIYSLKDNTKLNFKMYMELLYWLEDNFGRKVDLININNINPIILKSVSGSMQVVL